MMMTKTPSFISRQHEVPLAQTSTVDIVWRCTARGVETINEWSQGDYTNGSGQDFSVSQWLQQFTPAELPWAIKDIEAARQSFAEHYPSVVKTFQWQPLTPETHPSLSPSLTGSLTTGQASAEPEPVVGRRSPAGVPMVFACSRSSVEA